MKTLIILPLICLFCFSCSNQQKSFDEKRVNQKIVLSEVENDHPNKETMEWLLNNYDEEFFEQKSVVGTLENQDLIQNIFHFQTKSKDITLLLIFCNNETDAQIVGNSNFLEPENNKKFGTNGAVLFVVSGNDKYEVNNVLQFFAGEE
jgi:hypothetical protein